MSKAYKIAVLGATSQIARDLIVSFSGVVESVPLITGMAKMPYGVVAERINHS